jgi:hypothetical protein
MTGMAPENGSAPARLPDAYFAAASSRFSPAALRAALWAWTASRATRKRLAADGIRAVVPAAPRLPAGATRAVQSVLRRVDAAPLERCLVLQAWLLACGESFDVIVGVDAEGGVPQHAWLPFETGEDPSRFKETITIPARGAAS